MINMEDFIKLEGKKYLNWFANPWKTIMLNIDTCIVGERLKLQDDLMKPNLIG